MATYKNVIAFIQTFGKKVVAQKKLQYFGQILSKSKKFPHQNGG